MNILLWLVTVIGTVGVASYMRLSLLNGTFLVAAGLLIGTTLDYVGFFSWLLFLAIAIVLNVDSIRQEYLTKPLFAFYRKIMPEMSRTEQEAIDDGTVWWDGEIFSGKPNWRNVHSIAARRLSAEEQAF